MHRSSPRSAASYFPYSTLGENFDALKLPGMDRDSFAGMDFILRYWKSAKDSAARRVGLSDKPLPRGVDAAKLP